MDCPLLGDSDNNPKRWNGLTRYQLLRKRGLEAVQNKGNTMNNYLTQAARDVEAAYQELQKARNLANDCYNPFQLIVLDQILAQLSGVRATLNQVTE